MNEFPVISVLPISFSVENRPFLTECISLWFTSFSKFCMVCTEGQRFAICAQTKLLYIIDMQCYVFGITPQSQAENYLSDACI